MSRSNHSEFNPFSSVVSVVVTELRKTLRSPIFSITVIGVIVMALMLGLMMFIKKYPDLAKSSILLSKATMMPGNADWRAFFTFFSQMICGAGLLVFGFCASWLFGREYSDRTIKDLLALPIPRRSMVIGKFIVLWGWCVLLFFISFSTALLIGYALQLPGWSLGFGVHCMLLMFYATLMNAGLNMLTSFFACWTRGVLAPVGFIIVALILGNFVAMLGFAVYYPWGIPMLFATKGIEGASLGAQSIAIVIATAGIGFIATLLRWRFADQN
jgi:ABC-2 type transport system permease protein